MNVALIGCGSWGARVARRLVTTPGVTDLVVIDTDLERARSLASELVCGWSAVPLEFLAVASYDAVVLATPPAHRTQLVRAALAGTPPEQIRIEKPLAETYEDAVTIAEMCHAAGTHLTVGFTLLHHPLYEAAFTYAELLGGVTSVRGMRVGRPPAHDVDPFTDLGIHTASLAAFLDVPCTRMIAAHMTDADARRTVLTTPGGDVTVDELEHVVRTPDGDIRIAADHDALGRDLAAWAAGTHRGTSAVALRAQRLTPNREERTCAA
jgi:predicted dehydrogenase